MSPLSKKVRYQAPQADADTFASQKEFLDSLQTVPIDSLAETSRRCGYCWKTYGESNPDQDDAELPVKFRCGHALGETCMKRLFALPEPVRFDLVRLSFAPGSRGAELGKDLHGYLEAHKTEKVGSRLGDADKEKIFTKLLGELSSSNFSTCLDADWNCRFVQALKPQANVVDIHLLENSLVFDLGTPKPSKGDPVVPSSVLFDSDGFFLPQSPGALDALLGSHSLHSATMSAGGLSDTSSESDLTSASVPTNSKAPKKFLPKAQKTVSPGDIKSTAELVSQIEKIKTELQELEKHIHDAKIAPCSSHAIFEPSPYWPTTPSGSFNSPISPDWAWTPMPVAGVQSDSKWAPDSPSQVESPDTPMDLKAELAMLQSKVKATHNKLAYMKLSQERIRQRKEARDVQVKQTTAVLVRSITKTYDAFLQYHRAAGQPPPTKKPKKETTCPGKKNLPGSLSITASAEQYELQMGIVQVAAVIYEHNVDAKHYEVPQPYMYKGKNPFVQLENSDEDDEDDNGSEDEDNDKVDLSGKVVFLTRQHVASCNGTQKDPKTEPFPIPDYLTWKDAKKIPDDCPLCRKVLFKKGGSSRSERAPPSLNFSADF